MADEYATDVTPESSPGTPDSPPAAPAPAPSAQSSGPENQIPYWRFREVNDGYRTASQEAAALRAQLAQAQQLMQHQFRQAQGSAQSKLPDGYDVAGEQLMDLMSRHPKFQQLMQLMQAAPALAMGYQSAQQVASQVQEQAAQRYISDEHQRLGHMARSAGLPSSESDVLQLSYQVAGLINGNTQARDRYLAGDRSILDRAFHIVRQSYDNHRRGANAALQQNKNALSRLPPRSAGGPPGQPSQMPRLDPDNPRAYESSLHKLAEKMMRE